ncbi:hypothetical protein LCGC14_1882430 [marine sediment metagenome]|uniref:Cytochrome c-552/DMSO reductase-like haem-binding domain-containing protein n=1 Tax=marine sediment metagenome TaxID=412755 RepID=A0A0F9IFT0_9ZZZZ
MKIKFKKLILFLIVLALPFGMLISIVISDLRTSAADPFTAYESSSELTVDGVADESAWTSAEALIVTTAGGDLSLTEITLKAVFTDTNIYMYASWADDTFSASRGRYNVSGYVYDQTLAAGGSEDRIAFMWEIGTIAGFSSSGCQISCHSLTGNINFSTGEVADMWHIKAARGSGAITSTATGITVDPATHELTAGTVSLHGYADDKHLDDVSRTNDAGDGPYRDNAEAGHAMWIEANPTSWIDAMILTEAEITAGEAINITAGVAGAWPNLTTAVDNYVALNANVPRHILRTPTLSHGDIEVALKWVNGVYTLETKRALDTGNVDDVAFDPTADETYFFSVAIFDNQGQEKDGILEHSTYNGPIELSFGADAASPAPIPGFDLLIIVGSMFGAVILYIFFKKRRK